MGFLTQLTTLGIYSNRLSGTIPLTMRLMMQLTFLDLRENQLTGTILTEMGFLT